jgi:hypothetical protein
LFCCCISALLLHPAYALARKPHYVGPQEIGLAPFRGGAVNPHLPAICVKPFASRLEKPNSARSRRSKVRFVGLVSSALLNHLVSNEKSPPKFS